MTKDFSSEFTAAGIENVRKAVDDFWGQAKKASESTEANAQAARNQAEDLGRRITGFAELNMAASLEFTQSIMGAKSPEELMKVNADFIKRQSEVLAKQGQEIGTATAAAAQDNLQRFHQK